MNKAILISIALIFIIAIVKVPQVSAQFSLNDKGVQWNIGRWYNQRIPNAYDLEGMKKDLDMMKSAGVTWVKFTLHKRTGTSLYDQLVPELNARGIRWLANVNNPNRDVNGKIVAGTEQQRAEYRAWLGSMVDRYKSQGLKYYEIWNEPNLSYFWNINQNFDPNDPVQVAEYKASVADYVKQLQDAYTTIKSRDPEAVVVLGGLSQWKYEAYVDELIALQAERYFDIFAFHPYGDKPTTSLGLIKNLKSRIAAKSPSMAAKPLWITEYGYSTSPDVAGYMGSGSTEQTKADYLVQSMDLFRKEGITLPMIWYNYNGDDVGGATSGSSYELIITNFKTLQSTELPAYVAFKNWSFSPSPSPTLIQKTGDANNDGKVDGIDYIVWLNNYNQTTSNGPKNGDFNLDKKVDGIDYILWLKNYGR